LEIMDEDMTFGEGLLAELEITRGGVGAVVLAATGAGTGVLIVGTEVEAGTGAGGGVALAALVEGAGGGGLGEVGEVRKFCDAERDLGGGGGIFLGF
jgi:hypothetical protein